MNTEDNYEATFSLAAFFWVSIAQRERNYIFLFLLQALKMFIFLLHCSILHLAIIHEDEFIAKQLIQIFPKEVLDIQNNLYQVSDTAASAGIF